MSIALALAAALSVTPATGVIRTAPHAATPGLIDVGNFNDKAMVRPVAAAGCVSGNFTKWPEAGCLRHADHDAPRK